MLGPRMLDGRSDNRPTDRSYFDESVAGTAMEREA